MNPYIQERLACLICHQALTRQDGGFRCPECDLSFPTWQGVPCLFGPGKEDLWAGNRSGLMRLLDENPQFRENLERQPEEALNGADTFAKAGLLQDQGRFLEAARLQQAAGEKCYSPAYRQSFRAHLDFIAESLGDCPGPVVDIASGRGMLLSHLLGRVEAPLVAADLSPTVLANGLAVCYPEEVASGRLTLLALDATSLPFRDNSLPAVTTCVGLQNIPNPEQAVRELRRVCAGIFYALCFFFPEDDWENQGAAAQFGLDGAYSQRRLTGLLESCGWNVRCFETPAFYMEPTPVGKAVPGYQVDGLPVAATNAQFITLVCE